MTRETTCTVLKQGAVRMLNNTGYNVIGGEDAVCFFIDPVERSYFYGHKQSAKGCPVALIDDGSNDLTAIEFTEFQGWRFHAGGMIGRSIAISLVRKGAEE